MNPALRDLADRAEDLLAAPVRAAGFAVLLCEWSGGSRPVLRVFIERPDGVAVSIDDCVTVHDAITDLLDAEEFSATAWTLEVSSPGLERPLKRLDHFVAHIGKVAKIRTAAPIGGRRHWKGELSAVEGDLIHVLDSGVDHVIPLGAIERANLVYEEPAPQKPKGPPKKSKPEKGAATRRPESPTSNRTGS